jgi:hypothetical protein
VLLTRDEFREAVFARDKNKCVVCDQPAADSHHIIERRLWPDGGYYLDNGVSLCGDHHLAAEATTISCHELRRLAKLARVVLPPHLHEDQEWDKWGNPILMNGQRLRGELFDDESVQKILKPLLHLFTSRVKYARTYHLPWSPGVTDDDRVQADLSRLESGPVVVTAKMDGECTTMYRDYLHARSLEFQPHPSRERVKALHGAIAHDIPDGWRLCGENLFAQHSIHYTRLKAHFLVFSVWNDKNECLSWDEAVEWSALLGLQTVPVLYAGKWSEAEIKRLYQPTLDGDPCEGYVVRTADSFHYRDFRYCVAKFVRVNHVAVHGGHWANRVVVPNEVVP